MNEITIALKGAQKHIILYSKANNILLKDGYIHFGVKGFLGSYRTLMLIRSDYVEFVNIKSECNDIVIKDWRVKKNENTN